MNVDCFIINDFLDDPDAVRHWVLDSAKKGHLSFDKTGPYPGVRSAMVGNEDYHHMIEEKLKKILPFKFKMDSKISSSYAYQLCLEGTYSSVHVDATKWGGVLYFPDNKPRQSPSYAKTPMLLSAQKGCTPCSNSRRMIEYGICKDAISIILVIFCRSERP